MNSKIFLLEVHVLRIKKRKKEENRVRVEFLPTDRSGGWNSDGCFMMNSTANETLCSCNHLTSFAILLVGVQSFPCSFLFLGKFAPTRPKKKKKPLILFCTAHAGHLQTAHHQPRAGHHPHLHHLHRLWSLCHFPVHHPPHLLVLRVRYQALAHAMRSRRTDDIIFSGKS